MDAAAGPAGPAGSAGLGMSATPLAPRLPLTSGAGHGHDPKGS